MFQLFGKKYHKITQKLKASKLNEDYILDIYLPKNLLPWQKLPLVVFNDGQDVAKMKMLRLLESLRKTKAIPPIMVVGIYANEKRMDVYGTAQQADYMNRGALAKEYAHFVIEEVIPFLLKNHRVKKNKISIAGFSLGGLSAFDIAWNHPIISSVGVFSGSLWWRSKAFNEAHPDDDLIVHEMVSNTQNVPKLNMWFQAGTQDEDSDRNKNGIIDAIDDTLQLMDILKQKGYKENTHFTYLEVEGGKHDVPTWESVMGEFFLWLIE